MSESRMPLCFPSRGPSSPSSLSAVFPLHIATKMDWISAKLMGAPATSWITLYNNVNSYMFKGACGSPPGDKRRRILVGQEKTKEVKSFFSVLMFIRDWSPDWSS